MPIVADWHGETLFQDFNFVVIYVSLQVITILETAAVHRITTSFTGAHLQQSHGIVLVYWTLVSVRESISLRTRKPCTHQYLPRIVRQKTGLSYGYGHYVPRKR